MKWRPHLPDDCPPENAAPTTGTVYRLAYKADFNEKDFLSYKEEGKKWNVAECTASGISVYTEIEGIKQLFRRVKSARRKKVLRGVLKPQHGKILNTPSDTHNSHHTWWIPADERPWEAFEVVELPEDRIS
ncbi:MAG: hypothetical protein SGI73_05015 [Chloroflexota bacterium]|nr:hypothetical protein [Chloroflexota bacterium]